MTVLILAAYLAASWVLYTKAGRAGWTALVPIYNLIVLGEIAGAQTMALWLIGLTVVPVAAVLFGAAAASAFGTAGGGFAFLILALGAIPWAIAAMVVTWRFMAAVARSFGVTSPLFVVGLVFLPLIFLPILAFGDYQYQGPATPHAAQHAA